ncbi:hypothetical protein F7Q99_32250 [Streptomyces kaniharaensis]|uniref:Uncharacterized protein n=1 Tax=Streptomyces kaniharaensis TaxID=212423 RepID=A0A6N7L1Z7_9ACTN|nr:hypothetical protein [Streptomyces kaniharaensis]MQS16737.1 hypothetical protein [Streptomyces kaniharaensis]
MHALHGLKGLTTCAEECGPEPHNWNQVQNDLVGAIIAAAISMSYNDPSGRRETFTETFHRRTRRGREASAPAA